MSPKAKIGNNCKIFPFAYIEDDVEIGDGCIIFPFVSILNGTRMGKSNKIHQGAVIGALPQDFNFRGEKSELIMGDNNIVRENVVINRATHTGGQTVIGNNNFLMEGAHISHDTKVGNACVFGYGTKIAGDCEIGNGVIYKLKRDRKCGHPCGQWRYDTGRNNILERRSSIYHSRRTACGIRWREPHNVLGLRHLRQGAEAHQQCLPSGVPRTDRRVRCLPTDRRAGARV